MQEFREDSYVVYKGDDSLSFHEWLDKYKVRDSNIGDFAYDVSRDSDFPIHASKEGMIFYMRLRNAHPSAISTCKEAHRGYKSYLHGRYSRTIDRENELLRIENAHLKRILEGERY